METIAVQLTEVELGLLRAGLAAHAIALRHADTSLAPEDRAPIYKQRDACRELSLKLGDAQVALYEQGA